MKQLIALALIAFTAMPALARQVRCFGYTYDGPELVVRLGTASKTQISRVTVKADGAEWINLDDQVIDVDSRYRPTEKYKDFQRYVLEKNGSAYVYLLLPENKSGSFRAHLQIREAGGEGETVRLRCNPL